MHSSTLRSRRKPCIPWAERSFFPFALPNSPFLVPQGRSAKLLGRIAPERLAIFEDHRELLEQNALPAAGLLRFCLRYVSERILISGISKDKLAHQTIYLHPGTTPHLLTLLPKADLRNSLSDTALARSVLAIAKQKSGHRLVSYTAKNRTAKL